jgi:hypothetical protein
MAVRSAGYDPDLAFVQAGGPPNFGGPAWQQPKFIAVAEAAYTVLAAPPFPEELNQVALEAD